MRETLLYGHEEIKKAINEICVNSKHIVSEESDRATILSILIGVTVVQLLQDILQKFINTVL